VARYGQGDGGSATGPLFAFVVYLLLGLCSVVVAGLVIAAKLGEHPLSSQSSPLPLPKRPPIDPRVISSLETYLKNSCDAQTGLCREAPNVAPRTRWVYSDGYLAGLNVSRWNAPKLRKWTPLVEGQAVSEEAFSCGTRTIELGGGARTEAEDPAVDLNDWQEYADRLLLAALSARHAGNQQRFDELLGKAHSMWDGKGLTDRVFTADARYETYKLALYYYLTGDPAVLEVLLGLQDRDPQSNRYGGVYTEYGADLKPFPHTDTNTETTAVTWRVLR
jgi:hypothetical protein